jgi:putative toxin-antitoxin system antitoxin component (TIGR02293 family)
MPDGLVEPIRRGVPIAVIETFGSQEKAIAWLHRPTASVRDRAPIELLDTDAGCHEVETALGRIDHGIAA